MLLEQGCEYPSLRVPCPKSTALFEIPYLSRQLPPSPSFRQYICMWATIYRRLFYMHKSPDTVTTIQLNTDNINKPESSSVITTEMYIYLYRNFIMIAYNSCVQRCPNKYSTFYSTVQYMGRKKSTICLSMVKGTVACYFLPLCFSWKRPISLVS